jgi:two-component system, cell cycle response regulator DivK
VPVVLIVDDNDKNRKLAASLLSAAGFETVEAATGAEGVALATERLPDVVLMDLRLPDMDGAEAARALHADERAVGVPVVAMTALRLEGIDDWLEDAGFAGWLEKPIRVDTFAEGVRGYCVDAVE